jgi:uncharacterized delta-60 repeat protein
VLIVGAILVVVTVDPDGKIRVAGVRRTFDLTSTDFALARYNADGGVDTAFGSGGRLTTDFNGSEDEARAVAIQSDGKIVAAGSSGAFPEFALARYNPDGSLDSSFGIGGEVTTNVSPIPGNGARAVAIDSGGKRRRQEARSLSPGETILHSSVTRLLEHSTRVLAPAAR